MDNTNAPPTIDKALPPQLHRGATSGSSYSNDNAETNYELNMLYTGASNRTDELVANLAPTPKLDAAKADSVMRYLKNQAELPPDVVLGEVFSLMDIRLATRLNGDDDLYREVAWMPTVSPAARKAIQASC